jgi:hypothetical protein
LLYDARLRHAAGPGTSAGELTARVEADLDRGAHLLEHGPQSAFPPAPTRP